jgi:hypothetical protein
MPANFTPKLMCVPTLVAAAASRRCRSTVVASNSSPTIARHVGMWALARAALV